MIITFTTTIVIIIIGHLDRSTVYSPLRLSYRTHGRNLEIYFICVKSNMYKVTFAIEWRGRKIKYTQNAFETYFTINFGKIIIEIIIINNVPRQFHNNNHQKNHYQNNHDNHHL